MFDPEHPCRIFPTRSCIVIDKEQRTVEPRYAVCPGLCHRFELDIPIEDGYTFL